MSYYDAGYESYWAGVSYDPLAAWAWRKGWLDAEEDDWCGPVWW